MKNRQPSPGKEGRVLITPEDGSAPFYAKLSMADEPIDEGTPLVMETLLSDATAAALGLTNSATVDDAFGKINATKLSLAGGVVAGRLPYVSTQNSLSQLVNPASDRAVLQQNKTGAPYWTDLSTFRLNIGMQEDLLAQQASFPAANEVAIDITGVDFNTYKYAKLRFKLDTNKTDSFSPCIRFNDYSSSYYKYYTISSYQEPYWIDGDESIKLTPSQGGRGCYVEILLSREANSNSDYYVARIWQLVKLGNWNTYPSGTLQLAEVTADIKPQKTVDIVHWAYDPDTNFIVSNYELWGVR